MSLPACRSFWHANAFCMATSEGLLSWQRQGVNARKNMCTVYKKIYLPLLLFPVLPPEISLSFMCCVLAKHPHDVAMENSPLLPLRLSAINEEDGERRNSPPLCSFVILCEPCIITIPKSLRWRRCPPCCSRCTMEMKRRLSCSFWVPFTLPSITLHILAMIGPRIWFKNILCVEKDLRNGPSLT